MKKAISLLILLGLFISFAANAQDAKAKSILDKVSTKFKSAKTMKANFALTINGANGKTGTSRKGTFLMKGKRYKVDMGKQQIICDGHTIWTYLVANKEVQISTFNPDEQTISPAKLFSGSYETEYKYHYSGTQTIGGKKVAVIELKPSQSGKSFSRVLLYIDQAASMITGGQIFEKNGNAYTYKISNVKTNLPVSDAEFTFDPKQHPGVDVIDLR